MFQCIFSNCCFKIVNLSIKQPLSPTYSSSFCFQLRLTCTELSRVDRANIVTHSCLVDWVSKVPWVSINTTATCRNKSLDPVYWIHGRHGTTTDDRQTDRHTHLDWQTVDKWTDGQAKGQTEIDNMATARLAGRMRTEDRQTDRLGTLYVLRFRVVLLYIVCWSSTQTLNTH